MAAALRCHYKASRRGRPSDRIHFKSLMPKYPTRRLRQTFGRRVDPGFAERRYPKRPFAPPVASGRHDQRGTLWVLRHYHLVVDRCSDRKWYSKRGLDACATALAHWNGWSTSSGLRQWNVLVGHVLGTVDAVCWYVSLDPIFSYTDVNATPSNGNVLRRIRPTETLERRLFFSPVTTDEDIVSSLSGDIWRPDFQSLLCSVPQFIIPLSIHAWGSHLSEIHI